MLGQGVCPHFHYRNLKTFHSGDHLSIVAVRARIHDHAVEVDAPPQGEGETSARVTAWFDIDANPELAGPPFLFNPARWHRI
ncbi:MAG: hypothetical protein WD942_04695 [Dehalococcoidia bacterium]